MKPVQVKLLGDTGFDIVTGGGYIVIPLPCAVGRWQERPDLIVVERRRIVIVVVVVLWFTVLALIVPLLGVEEPDREWRWLCIRLLARYI